jgi:hypothetical protein
MSQKFTFTTELFCGEHDDVPYEVEITYSVSPFIPATHEQPAEGGEVELLSAKVGGIEVKLTDELEAELLTKCEERAEQDMRDRLEADADAVYEARRERRSDEWWQP